jgi:hypothetical protein
MGNKRLLTLDDLCNYYSTHSRSTHFSSKDSGSPVVVQVPGNLFFDAEDNSTEGLLPVVLQACHTGKNVNDSIINTDVMERSLSSFKNRPILGYIHEVDGECHFYKHNLHEGEDGEIIYDEIPVGIVPESCDAKLEYDEEKDKTYVVINGYIFEEYSKAAEILRREKECAVSVELSIREFSYNAKEHCLVIEDFYFSGVTILGKHPDGENVVPGMSGSNIKLADFSAKNNSLFEDKYETQIIEMQEKLDKLISCFNIDNSKKGGISMNHFEELLAKYSKTVDDITFEYEGMSDEELDAKFEELFGEGETEPEDDSVVVENSGETEEVEVTEEKSEITEVVEAMVEDETFTRTYELSHDDIRCALYALLLHYEEADNTYYYISEVFDGYFVYESWCGSTVYGQAYIKDEETVSFDGERYELFKELLTASEKAELEAMRSNYAAISEKLKVYEDAEIEAKKVELLNADDYVFVRGTEVFAELVKDHENISYEELQSKCDQIILDAVKSGKYSAVNSVDDTTKTSKKQFTNPTVKKTKPSRYGKLFAKEDK